MAIIVWEREARAMFSVAVVACHILLVFFAAYYLSGRITKFETYLSSLGAFLPVFGVYVGIVVQNISVSRGPRGKKVSNPFLFIMTALLASYLACVVSILLAFGSNFIQGEDALPAALAFAEAAFGAFFTTIFLKLMVVVK